MPMNISRQELKEEIVILRPVLDLANTPMVVSEMV